MSEFVWGGGIALCFILTVWFSSDEIVKAMKGETGEQSLAEVGKNINMLTEEQDVLIMFDQEWNAEIPYYSERKAIAVTGKGSIGEGINPYELAKKQFRDKKYVVLCGTVEKVSATLSYLDMRDLFPMTRIYSGYTECLYKKIEDDFETMEWEKEISLTGTIRGVKANGGDYIVTGQINGVAGNYIAACYDSGNGIIPVITSLYTIDTIPYDHSDEDEGDFFAFKVNQNIWKTEREHELIVLIHDGVSWKKAIVTLEG